ncbi:MAG: ZPR1 zinc finger domain-containing protein [Euryarchaeota archaeon]|nr:ZPR1 zinc finger domain-containing protein [Euryarchaeota archaeon]
MRTRKMRLASPCPACQQQTVEYTAAELDVPYFGNILEAVFICSECGFRHSDVIVGTQREPRRWTYRTRGAADMSVRVVRSTSCTVRIPELGVLIEPGPASDAFVSNIEGLLVRVEAVVSQLGRDAEDAETKGACEERLAQLAAARAGTLPITVILEDPYGNSLIAHDEAVSELISAAEAENLPRGEISFDVSELRPSSGGPTNGHKGREKS